MTGYTGKGALRQRHEQAETDRETEGSNTHGLTGQDSGGRYQETDGHRQGRPGTDRDKDGHERTGVDKGRQEKGQTVARMKRGGHGRSLSVRDRNGEGTSVTDNDGQ